MTSNFTKAAAAGSIALLCAGAASAQPNINDFTKIRASGNIHLTVEIGPDYEILAERNGGTLTVKRRGDTLIVDREIPAWRRSVLWKHPRIDVTIKAPEISAIHARFGAEVESVGTPAHDFSAVVEKGATLAIDDLSSGDLDVVAQQGAVLNLAGSCEHFTAKAEMGAVIYADDLTCRTGDLTAAYGAEIDVTIQNSVEAEAAMGASIDLDGHPQITRLETSFGGAVVN